MDTNIITMKMHVTQKVPKEYSQTSFAKFTTVKKETVS